MIQIKEFKAALKAAIFLADIHNDIIDYKLDDVIFEFNSSLSIYATCSHSLLKVEFMNAEPGGGRIAISGADCKNMLQVLPKDGEILVTIAGDSLILCHGINVFTYTGPIEFNYPDCETILDCRKEPPQGYKASLDFRFLNGTLKHLAPVVDDQRLNFFIKGKSQPFFVKGFNENFRFDLVVMPLVVSS